MSAMTLDECRRLKLEAGELARAGWESLRAVCLRESTIEERAKALAVLEGAERERQILARMELELIGSGRVSLEMGCDEPEAKSAVVTPEWPNEAGNRPANARGTAMSELTQPPKQD
jgi:hypothetical protein